MTFVDEFSSFQSHFVINLNRSILTGFFLCNYWDYFLGYTLNNKNSRTFYQRFLELNNKSRAFIRNTINGDLPINERYYVFDNRQS